MPRENAAPSLTGGALTRSRILDAAARLMSTVGMTRTTTKEIARETGVSEAALYKHFRDKEEIFLGVLHERAPRFPDVLAQLPGRAGEREVADQLTEVARDAVLFYRQTFPIGASLFSSPELLAGLRRKIDVTTSGPHQATERLAAYLGAERDLGRISADIDPYAAATLLLGACFHRAFLELFYTGALARALRPERLQDFAAEAVRALINGITP